MLHTLMLREIVASIVFVLALGSSEAAAHGRAPALNAIRFDPTNPDRIVARSTFGLIVSPDRGNTWNWICGAAYGIDTTIEDPAIAIAADSSTLLGTFTGMVRGSDSLCDFVPPTGLPEDEYIADVVVDPTNPARVWGLVSPGTDPNLIVRSDDSGASWARVGEPVVGVLLERIALAPSDAMRVYATGAILETEAQARRGILMRSDDGGSGFERVEMELLDGERFPQVVGIDPTDADRLFVRMARSQFDSGIERLLFSDDGGRTFATVLEAPWIMGFAISDDGLTAWAGSALGGLWIARDRGSSFESISEIAVACSAWHEGTLWLCTNPWTEGFALGRSSDDGASIDPVVQISDVTQLPSCAPTSSTGMVCPGWMADLLADYAAFMGSDAGPVVSRDAGVDASTMPPPPPPTGCACASARRYRQTDAGALIALAAAFAVWRVRRRAARLDPSYDRR